MKTIEGTCKNVDKLSSWPLKSELPSAPREARPGSSSQASRFLQPWLLLQFDLEGNGIDHEIYGEEDPVGNKHEVGKAELLSEPYVITRNTELDCSTNSEQHTCLPCSLNPIHHNEEARRVVQWNKTRCQYTHPRGHADTGHAPRNTKNTRSSIPAC